MYLDCWWLIPATADFFCYVVERLHALVMIHSVLSCQRAYACMFDHYCIGFVLGERSPSCLVLIELILRPIMSSVHVHVQRFFD